MMTNVKHNSINLVNDYEENIKGSKLPSNKQVLCFFQHNHNMLHETVRDSATKTVEKVLEFWNRARIPIHHKQDCFKKLDFLKNVKV